MNAKGCMFVTDVEINYRGEIKASDTPHLCGALVDDSDGVCYNGHDQIADSGVVEYEREDDDALR